MIVYTLQLENGKYYVGRTHNFQRRYQEHLDGHGSTWTSRYTPISCMKTFETDDSFDENKIVKQMMNQYGIDNVRGGSYSMIRLSANDISTIKKEIADAIGLCFICNGNHYANVCRSKNRKTSIKKDGPIPSMAQARLKAFGLI